MDRSICVWDTESGALRCKALGHRGDVTSVQFLPDGRLLSASRDKTYRLTVNGTKIGELVVKNADDFQNALLMVRVKAKNIPSPVVYSLRLAPLEGAPTARP